MKLQTSTNKGEVGGALSETAFGIGNGTLLLEYLRSNIYKNPIQALTREIASNARDAHREVDTDSSNPTTRETPIQITFPNEWNGDFQVQDCGPGISPERMATIFTQFGNSTKRDSNDESGGFGLGCKTPFAYGDSFTVTTIHDGIKYHYSAILDGGAGKMVLLSQEDTDEPSGTIVSVPVHRDDWNEFTNYTMLATALWDVKPILKGINPAPEYPKVETYFGGEGWVLANSHTFREIPGLDSGTYAVVDGIPYKVERYNMGNIDYGLREAFDCSFHLNFEIGELDLAPSRDHLRYTKETQALILDRIQIAIVELKKQIQEKIADAPTYFDAAIAYRNLKAETSAEVISLAGGCRWQGIALKFDVDIKDVGSWSKMTKFWLDYGDFKCKRTHTTLHPMADDILVLYNDQEKSIPRRSIQALLEDTNKYKAVEIITCPAEPTSREFRQHMKWYPNSKVEYNLDILDRYRIGKLSAYPMPRGRQTNYGGRRKAADGNIMGYSFWANRDGNLCTNSVEVTNDGGVYIEVNYKDRVYTTGDRQITDERMLKYLEAFIGEKVVGFSQTRIKKLDSEWRPLEEVVKEKVEEYLEDVTVEELRDAKFSGTYAFSSKFCNLKRLEEDLSIFHHQDGAMVTYIMACNEIAETRKIADKIWSALSLLDYDLGQPKEVPIAAQYAKAVDAYRLLPYIEGYNMKEETYQEVIRYINLIDAELASAAALVALAS